MAIVSAAVLKSYFEDGDTPTGSQFSDLVDSTFSDEIGAALVSAVRAGSTGLAEITDASSMSFLVPGSAGRAVVSAGTGASVRTAIGAASTSAATTASAGLIEIATTAEVTAGSDATRAVTPAGLAALEATTARSGLIEIATTAEATAGTDNTRAITPATLAVAATAGFYGGKLIKFPGEDRLGGK